MSDKNWEPAHIENASCIHETDGGALKVRVDGKDYWIPSKLVTDDSEVYKKGDEGTLVIPTWLGIEKGLV